MRQLVTFPDGTERADRTGPYTLATLVQMQREGTLGRDQLVSTTDAIYRDKDFPDGPRRSSGRWVRVDQLGDEVHRRMEAEGALQEVALMKEARAAALAGEGPAAPLTVRADG